MFSQVVNSLWKPQWLMSNQSLLLSVLYSIVEYSIDARLSKQLIISNNISYVTLNTTATLTILEHIYLHHSTLLKDLHSCNTVHIWNTTHFLNTPQMCNPKITASLYTSTTINTYATLPQLQQTRLLWTLFMFPYHVSGGKLLWSAKWMYPVWFLLNQGWACKLVWADAVPS